MALVAGDPVAGGLGVETPPEDGTFVGISSVVRGRVLLADHLWIQAALPFATAFGPGTAFRIANPAASASYLWKLPQNIWMSLGLGLTAPVATLPSTGPLTPSEIESTVVAAGAYGLAAAASGLSAWWEFAADTFNVYVPYQVGIETRNYRFSAHLAYAHSFAIHNRLRDHGNAVEVGLGAQWHLTHWLSLGGRLRDVTLVWSDIHEFTSLEPFVELSIAHVQVGLGVLFNLNDIPATAGDTYPWAARLSVGFRL